MGGNKISNDSCWNNWRYWRPGNCSCDPSSTKRNEVLLGSRSFEKALTAVKIIKSEKNYQYLENHLKPAENLDIVKTCDALLLTVPHDNAIETMESLSQSFRGNQLLISTVAAVTKKGEEFIAVEDPSGKSFAQRISERIPSSVKIAVAFQTVPRIFYTKRGSLFRCASLNR